MPSDQPISIILYTGPHCHLCDQAKDVIYPLLPEFNAELEEVDISGSEALKDSYGLRIPVIKIPDGEEKGWPFTTGQVKKMLAAQQD